MSILQMEQYTDEVLLQHVAQGSKAAFKQLYEKYWEQMYGDAYKRLNDSYQAKDIVQEVFAYIWVKREVLKIENLAGYLKVAVRNRILNHLSREKYTHSFFRMFDQASVSTMHADDAVLWKEFVHSYESLLSILPSKRQIIFRLRFQEDLPTKDIARQLGLSRKTVQNQLNKALEQLRVSLLHIFIIAFLLDNYW